MPSIPFVAGPLYIPHMTCMYYYVHDTQHKYRVQLVTMIGPQNHTFHNHHFWVPSLLPAACNFSAETNLRANLLYKQMSMKNESLSNDWSVADV